MGKPPGLPVVYDSNDQRKVRTAERFAENFQKGYEDKCVLKTEDVLYY